MDLVCRLEDLKIEKYNNRPIRHNKQVDKKKHKKQKAMEEKEKLAKEVVALNAKIQELVVAKNATTKAVEETIIQLTTKKLAPEVDLDVALAKLKRNFIKGNQWQNSVTRRGHYLGNLYHKLDTSFFVEHNFFLQSLLKEYDHNLKWMQEFSVEGKKREGIEKEIVAKQFAFEANRWATKLSIVSE